MTGNNPTPGWVNVGTNVCSGWQQSSMTAAQNAINQTTYNSAELPTSRYPNGIVHFINCVAEGPAPGVTPNGAGTPDEPKHWVQQLQHLGHLRLV